MSDGASAISKARLDLIKLRDSFAVKAAGAKPTTSLESIEWKRLSVQTRMLLLVFSGVDGELETLALRDWHELPRPEQHVLILSIRRMRSEFMGLVALARHA